jgi:hypothetical protein
MEKTQRLKESLSKKGRAFLDGIYTGIDPLGCAYGHFKKDISFLGYRADEYSNEFGSLMNIVNHIAESYCEKGISLKPISRSLDEQVIKGIGSGIALSTNLAFLFLPQIAATGFNFADLAKKSLEKKYHSYLHKNNQGWNII